MEGIDQGVVEGLTFALVPKQDSSRLLKTKRTPYFWVQTYRSHMPQIYPSEFLAGVYRAILLHNMRGADGDPGVLDLQTI